MTFLHVNVMQLTLTSDEKLNILTQVITEVHLSPTPSSSVYNVQALFTSTIPFCSFPFPFVQAVFLCVNHNNKLSYSPITLTLTLSPNLVTLQAAGLIEVIL